MSEYPPDWRMAMMKVTVEKITSGGTPKADNPDLYGGSIPFLKIDDITSSSKYLRSHKVTINERGLSESSAKIVPAGTLLLTMYGTIGRCCITTYPVATNQAIASFLGHPETELEYLYYALESKADEFATASSQTTQANISAGILKQTPIAVPPLPEQKKIAEILSGIDRQLDLMRCQESKSHELLRAMLHSVFSEPDLSPYSDNSNSLAELEEQGRITLGRGNIISKIDIRERPGGYPIYSSSGKGDGKFGEYGEYMFDEELITWSIDGGGRLFHRSRHKFSVTNVCGYLRRLDNSIDYKYLHSALEYQHGRIRFDYSHKAHPSVIRELYSVALPPIERQREIASAIASVNQQTGAIANKINALATLKSAISSDLLSGRKRVSV